ncbi:MAG: cytochrome c oxidase assembly protein, partial [Betaproteobacteria bacterium]|nr:cytochrome c oxidase assembly protein [Betaproteobacteria bacterium]
MSLHYQNSTMLGKLAVVVLAMFGFGYALVPIYNAICQMTGVNILALAELAVPGEKAQRSANSQVDTSRTITVEFDANSRGPWQFKPAQSSLQV